jgi:xanthine dehydrogenase accessory factor
MLNKLTWKLISQSLEHKVAVMLLYVMESKGSSPGRQGFFMAVNAMGKMQGSIGGGIMEHKFVEMAKEQLMTIAGETLTSTIKKQIHDKSVAKNQSGMICSGEQTILLYKIKEHDKPAIQHIISSLEQNKNGTLILSPAGIQFDAAIPQKNFVYTFESESNWLYKEKTGFKEQLFIIGGGHCALAFSKLMAQMDFYIRVYDERRDLKTLVENEAAHEKHIINDYTQLKELIPSGDNHYVVIMTFGYRSDDTALRSLLGKNFRYTGVLGSQHKMEKLFDEYRKEGIKEEWLQRIHSPVGLAIKSQTPEEIAVSIAAEIIQVKNERL